MSSIAALVALCIVSTLADLSAPLPNFRSNAASGGFCPQIAYDTRDEFARFIDAPGWDLTFWNHGGSTVVGSAAGGSATVGAMGTTTLANGQAFVATGPFAKIANATDLFNNGDQVFLVLADIAPGASLDSNCTIQIGTTKKICINRDGSVSVSNRFGLIAGSTPPTASEEAVVVQLRRHLKTRTDENSGIQIDFEKSFFRGTSFVRADASNSLINLPDAVWGFDNGFQIIGPVATGQTDTIKQVIVLEGRDDKVNHAGGNLPDLGTAATLSTDAKNLGQCNLEEWHTNTINTTAPRVVPGSSVNNLILSYTRANFGPGGTAAAPQVSEDIKFVPVFDDISNFTSVTVTNGAIAAGFSGNDASTTQLTLNAIDIGQANTVTFTATVFNCTHTAIPRNSTSGDNIRIGTFPAYIYIARQSRLQFIVRDIRHFDLHGLPIAAGCEVPLNYTIDVKNFGPSCVQDLVLSTIRELPDSCTDAIAGTESTPDFTATRIFPGELRSGKPVAYSIDAFANAANEQLLNRSLHIVSPPDGGLISIDHPAAFYTFFRRHSIQTPENTNILNLTYDVSRYGDIQLQFAWDDSTAVAGDFSDNNVPNLRGTLSVKNAGCVTINDIEVALQIELPRGGWYFDVNGEGASGVAQRSTPINRRILISALTPGEAETFPIDFAVCQITKASAAGLNVIAYVRRAGDNTFNGELSQYETLHPTNEGVESPSSTECRRIVPVRPFDDKIDDYPTITLQAVLETTLTCDAPVLTAPGLAIDANNDDSSDDSDVQDVALLKITRCRVNVTNTGSSDVPIKIDVNWVLPSSTRLVRWATPNNDHNQFVLSNGGGVWTVVARSRSDDAPLFTECPLRDTTDNVLEFDFGSSRPGEIQVVARVDKTASTAAFDVSSTFGAARSISV